MISAWAGIGKAWPTGWRLSQIGWTQTEIGERLGVSQDTVSLITKNFDTELLRSGHTPAEIGERLGVSQNRIIVCSRWLSPGTTHFFSRRRGLQLTSVAD